jgi:hypothetical protein
VELIESDAELKEESKEFEKPFERDGNLENIIYYKNNCVIFFLFIV